MNNQDNPGEDAYRGQGHAYPMAIPEPERLAEAERDRIISLVRRFVNRIPPDCASLRADGATLRADGEKLIWDIATIQKRST